MYKRHFIKRYACLILCLGLFLCLTAACGRSGGTEDSTTTEGGNDSGAVAATPPAQDPAPSDDAEPPPPLRPVITDLSEDMYSCQLQINEYIYQLPLEVSEFFLRGWTYRGDAEAALQPGASLVLQTLNMDSGLFCNVDIINYDDVPRVIGDCFVYQIHLASYMLKDSGAAVTLPGGVSMGSVTAEQAAKLMNTATFTTSTGSGASIVEFIEGDERSITLHIPGEGSSLTQISIKNNVVPDYFVRTVIKPPYPDIAANYRPPELIGDFDFTFELDGTLYALPAPLSAFTDDGWLAEAPKSLEVDDSAIISLKKDGDTLNALVYNYSGGTADTLGCFVTRISTEDDGLVISNGIRNGVIMAALESLLENTPHETGSMSGYIYYRITPNPQRSIDLYNIFVDPETSLICKIEMTYQPSQYGEAE